MPYPLSPNAGALEKVWHKVERRFWSPTDRWVEKRSRKSNRNAVLARAAIEKACPERTLDPQSEKQIREYAADTFGSSLFSPWLETYAACRGAMIPGCIPDNYHKLYVVPHTNAAFGALSSTLNGKLFSQSRFPDIAYVLYGKAYSLDGSPIASQDLVKTILSDHGMVYLKRSKALRGLGVTHCDSSNLAREIASCSGAIIQRPLTIHHNLTEVFAKATPTLRITTVHVDGQSRVVSACMRFGTGQDQHVISHSQVAVPIHLETGNYHAEGHLSDWTPVLEHPDTKATFKGRTVPAFEEACKVCCEEHARFPCSQYLGWDVAVTADEGIMMFETNTGHAGIHLLEASQGPIFAGLGWDKLHLANGEA